MDLASDLDAMLADWDTAIIGGVTYRGVFDHQVYQLEGGVERLPTFRLSTADVEAANVALESDVKVDGVTYQVRNIDKQDDGRETVLVLTK